MPEPERKKHNREWKPKLLSSGLPLEFEAAKILADAGFHVESDYSYHRRVHGPEVEFSVDIRASRTTPPPDQAVRGCPFDMLVECKHRTRQVMWLFVPAVNATSTPWQHEVLRGVDSFAPWFLSDMQWWTGHCDLPVVYKGVEIDLANAQVDDSELRRGLFQLQFALSALLRSRIDVPATSFGVIDNTPILFSPILVTNVPLVVASAEFSSSFVDRCRQPSDLGREVDALLIKWPVGRDFFLHSQHQFAGFDATVSRKGIRAAEEHRKAQGVNAGELPSSLARRVTSAGDEIEALAEFEYIIVCRLQHLAAVAANLSTIADRLGKNASLTLPAHMRR